MGYLKVIAMLEESQIHQLLTDFKSSDVETRKNAAETAHKFSVMSAIVPLVYLAMTDESDEAKTLGRQALDTLKNLIPAKGLSDAIVQEVNAKFNDEMRGYKRIRVLREFAEILALAGNTELAFSANQLLSKEIGFVIGQLNHHTDQSARRHAIEVLLENPCPEAFLPLFWATNMGDVTQRQAAKGAFERLKKPKGAQLEKFLAEYRRENRYDASNAFLDTFSRLNMKEALPSIIAVIYKNYCRYRQYGQHQLDAYVSMNDILSISIGALSKFGSIDQTMVNQARDLILKNTELSRWDIETKWPTIREVLEVAIRTSKSNNVNVPLIKTQHYDEKNVYAPFRSWMEVQDYLTKLFANEEDVPKDSQKIQLLNDLLLRSDLDDNLDFMLVNYLFNHHLAQTDVMIKRLSFQRFWDIGRKNTQQTINIHLNDYLFPAVPLNNKWLNSLHMLFRYGMEKRQEWNPSQYSVYKLLWKKESMQWVRALYSDLLPIVDEQDETNHERQINSSFREFPVLFKQWLIEVLRGDETAIRYLQDIQEKANRYNEGHFDDAMYLLIQIKKEKVSGQEYVSPESVGDIVTISQVEEYGNTKDHSVFMKLFVVANTFHHYTFGQTQTEMEIEDMVLRSAALAALKEIQQPDQAGLDRAINFFVDYMFALQPKMLENQLTLLDVQHVERILGIFSRSKASMSTPALFYVLSSLFIAECGELQSKGPRLIEGDLNTSCDNWWEPSEDSLLKDISANKGQIFLAILRTLYALAPNIEISSGGLYSYMRKFTFLLGIQ